MAAPALRMGWLLRSCAIASVIASVLGVLVAPGSHGTYREAIVERIDWTSMIASYGMGVLLVLAIMMGAWDLGRAHSINIAARIGAIGPSLVVVGLFVPACATKLPSVAAALLVVAASFASFVAALVAARTPHTRAAALALGLFGFDALLRLIAWQFANHAANAASMGSWTFARVLATIALVLEALGEMVCVAWLASRTKTRFSFASFLALAASFGIVWASSRGTVEGAPSWQLMLHLSLGDAVKNPPPFGGAGVPTFLAVSAITLAVAVAARPKVPAAITTVMALALLSHGGLDVPLHALAAIAASLWVMVTMTDNRVFWREVVEDKKTANALAAGGGGGP